MERIHTDDGLRLVCMLTRQLDAVARLQSAQEAVRQSVLKRDWEGFDDLIARMDSAAAAFASLEEERVSLWASIGMESGAGGYYQSIHRFPDEERRELSRLYRSLKLETLRVKLANDALMGYIQQAKLTINSFLGAAFPDRRGTLYSRSGRSVDSEMRSIVLNKTF